MALHYITWQYGKLWWALHSQPLHSQPLHSQTYSVIWQADRCTSQRMAFRALLNSKVRPFPSLCSSFLCAYCSKNCQNGFLLKNSYVLSIIDQLRAWAHRLSAYAQLSPLYPSLYPYVTHVINYSRPSPAFPYWKRRKAGRGLGTRLCLYDCPLYIDCTMLLFQRLRRGERQMLLRDTRLQSY